MNDLKTIDIHRIRNPDLKNNIVQINRYYQTTFNSQWGVAECINTIMKSKLYNDDFETEQDFATFMSISRSHLNKLKRCVDYRDNCHLDEYMVSQVLEMLTIPIENIENFIDTMEVTEKDSVRVIREKSLEYRGKKKT